MTGELDYNEVLMIYVVGSSRRGLLLRGCLQNSIGGSDVKAGGCSYVRQRNELLMYSPVEYFT